MDRNSRGSTHRGSFVLGQPVVFINIRSIALFWYLSFLKLHSYKDLKHTCLKGCKTVFKTCGLLWESWNLPKLKLWRLQLSLRLVKQWAVPHFCSYAEHRAESVQDKSLSFHFTVAVTVPAKPEENKDWARFCVVDKSCQRMCVIKPLLSVLLAPTQRSHRDFTMNWHPDKEFLSFLTCLLCDNGNGLFFFLAAFFLQENLLETPLTQLSRDFTVQNTS